MMGVMTKAEIMWKLLMVEEELGEIELKNDKSKRLRWRELNKIKKYYETLLSKEQDQPDDVEQIKMFIENRLRWNISWKERDPKASDIGRIEEDKCILRFIDHLKEKKNENKTDKTNTELQN